MKLQEYFLVVREYYNACMCIPLIENKAQHIQVLRQNAGSCLSCITRMRRGTLVNKDRHARVEIVE